MLSEIRTNKWNVVKWFSTEGKFPRVNFFRFSSIRRRIFINRLSKLRFPQMDFTRSKFTIICDVRFWFHNNNSFDQIHWITSIFVDRCWLIDEEKLSLNISNEIGIRSWEYSIIDDYRLSARPDFELIKILFSFPYKSLRFTFAQIDWNKATTKSRTLISFWSNSKDMTEREREKKNGSMSRSFRWPKERFVSQHFQKETL